MAAVTHADLSNNKDALEGRIVATFGSLTRQQDSGVQREERLKQLEAEVREKLQRLGIENYEVILRKKNSIAAYWLCRSVQKLEELRRHYESGLMKMILEEIFMLLAGENIHIQRLVWSSEDYIASLSQFGELYAFLIKQDNVVDLNETINLLPTV